MPPSADNANEYINLHQCNFFSTHGLSRPHGQQRDSKFMSSIYFSYFTVLCINKDTCNASLCGMADRHSYCPSTVALNCAHTRTKHILKDKHY
jgi:hypothetical protein